MEFSRRVLRKSYERRREELSCISASRIKRPILAYIAAR